MRFIMDTGIMSGNNPSKVHSQAFLKGLLAISSLVLVKCFYLYVDQWWLEQAYCQYTPKIRAECRQCLSLIPLQSPNLLLLRNESGGGFLLALSVSAQANFLHCSVGNIHMFVFKWATGPRDALIMDTQRICV